MGRIYHDDGGDGGASDVGGGCGDDAEMIARMERWWSGEGRRWERR